MSELVLIYYLHLLRLATLLLGISGVRPYKAKYTGKKYFNNKIALSEVLKNVIYCTMAFTELQQSRTIQSAVQSDLAFLSIPVVITYLYAFVCNDVGSNYVSAFAECQLNIRLAPQSKVRSVNK